MFQPQARLTAGAVLWSGTADINRPVLVDAAGTLTYGTLIERVEALAAELPGVHTGRRLVHVPLTAKRELVVGYLAVLKAGHVALITPPEHASITTAYPPDIWIHDDGTFAGSLDDAIEPQYELHPELAALMSTSGSTGSPKLVRLSHTNLVSNADAIAAALSISPDDRAITSLPLHYCFGLSVLHAQLRAGATAVLWHGSVTDPTFADELRRNAVSLLPATPHVVDLLDVQGVLDDLPSLRLLAQAGGALPAVRVKELDARGRVGGWGLAVMYGQTEATARMAVLPPELAGQYPDAVGWPIAGSAFRLDPEGVEQPADGPVGELVFIGPGVMLGYAEHPDDLALGRVQTELRTGDLARIGTDGLVRIVGRRSDHVKIMGIRIDLGQVERALRTNGVPCCVTGTDDQLQVTYQPCGQEPAAIRDQAASAAGLGVSVVSTQEVPELPILPNGKPDRRACAALHTTVALPTDDVATETAIGVDGSLAAVVALLAPLLRGGVTDPDRSFAELGGDSFNHVMASLRLTRLIGELPPDWHHRPVRDLAVLADQRRQSRPVRRALTQRVETTVLLRGVAVITICGSHVDLFRLAGGAHILLAVAGFLFARYVLTARETADRVRRTTRAVVGIAVPALVVAAVMVFVSRSIHWSNLALVHWLVRPRDINIFWFVEALLMLSVLTTAVLALPLVRRAYAADPWRTAMAALAVLLVPRYLVLALVEGPVRGLPGTVAWLFVAGIAMAVADTGRRRVVTAIVAAAATIGFFPVWERNLTILAGLVLLTLLPTVPVPGLLVRPLGVLAAASLHIYLVQFQVFAFFDKPIVQFLVSIAAGLAFCAVSTFALRRLPLRRPARGTLIRRLETALNSVREDRRCVDARS